MRTKKTKRLFLVSPVFSPSLFSLGQFVIPPYENFSGFKIGFSPSPPPALSINLPSAKNIKQWRVLKRKRDAFLAEKASFQTSVTFSGKIVAHSPPLPLSIYKQKSSSLDYA